MNSLHDAAFDVGLMTIDPSGFEVRLSSKIEESMSESTYEDYFRKYDGMPIKLPSKSDCPKSEYLEYHKHNIFDKGIRTIRLELELIE